jgi:hypothetical protein
MKTSCQFRISYVGWALALVASVALIAVACGGPAAPAEPSAERTVQPTSTVAIPNPTPTFTPAAAAATPTPVAQATAAPQEVASTRDSITVVTSNEPASLDIHNEFCSGNIDHMACKELTVDPLPGSTPPDSR